MNEAETFKAALRREKLEVHIEDEKHWVTGARKGVR